MSIEVNTYLKTLIYQEQENEASEIDRSGRWSKEFYSIQNGAIETVTLNAFQRFARAAFGAYKETHLKNITQFVKENTSQEQRAIHTKIANLAKERGLLYSSLKYGTWNMGYSATDFLDILVQNEATYPENFEEIRGKFEYNPSSGRLKHRHKEGAFKTQEEYDDTINAIMEAKKTSIRKRICRLQYK